MSEDDKKKTSTLINYYKSQNKFFEIEGIGEIDEISQRLFNVIDLIIK
jgi:adenylate kinase